jgi:uncharacterized protein
VEFEWDPEKNRANLAKHGIDFEGAISIFEGRVLERLAGKRDHGELRFIAFGVANGHELAVVYTLRAGRRRIISARRAHRREREEYRQAYPEDPPAR